MHLDISKDLMPIQHGQKFKTYSLNTQKVMLQLKEYSLIITTLNLIIHIQLTRLDILTSRDMLVIFTQPTKESSLVQAMPYITIELTITGITLVLNTLHSLIPQTLCTEENKLPVSSIRPLFTLLMLLPLEFKDSTKKPYQHLTQL